MEPLAKSLHSEAASRDFLVRVTDPAKDSTVLVRGLSALTPWDDVIDGERRSPALALVGIDPAQNASEAVTLHDQGSQDGWEKALVELLLLRPLPVLQLAEHPLKSSVLLVEYRQEFWKGEFADPVGKRLIANVVALKSQVPHDLDVNLVHLIVSGGKNRYLSRSPYIANQY
ncbi:hypothetical protein [Silanimonas sp.]|uniref:hypothetical protein n=1 Tax=Silanimonas sp. TaxID=1929290 RepID=UPI0022C95863|nr:hypothetical protein [Silanimonas sp.]MCZ8115982.1 hypothetical protein [Silanimonas sp.]